VFVPSSCMLSSALSRDEPGSVAPVPVTGLLEVVFKPTMGRHEVIQVAIPTDTTVPAPGTAGGVDMDADTLEPAQLPIGATGAAPYPPATKEKKVKKEKKSKESKKTKRA
jgi:hypothetical protein